MNSNLTKNAANPGFVNVPLYNFIKNKWNDGLGECDYAEDAALARWPLDSTYTAADL